jgi:asparaginyl-tRNA synthetase
MLAKGTESSFFVKKQTEEPAKDADADGYAPISTSASKKAKKLYEAALKKKQKQAEMASKAQEEEGKDDKRLEESKKIVLPEPKGTYNKVSIRSVLVGALC